MFALKRQTVNKLFHLEASYARVGQTNPAHRACPQTFVTLFTGTVTIFALEHLASSPDFKTNWTLEMFPKVIAHLLRITHVVRRAILTDRNG